MFFLRSRVLRAARRMKSIRTCGCAVFPLLGVLSNNDRCVDKNSRAAGDAGDDKDHK